MMTADDLKYSILQLAMQGKLVEQRSEEGTGESLYQIMRADREKLIRQKKIKKDKPLSSISEDELLYDIPQNWKAVRVGEIGSWSAGATPSRSHPEYYGGNIPWLKTGDLNDGDIYEVPEFITEEGVQHSSVRLNPVGTVLMAMYGATIGKLGILQIEATTNQACCACICYEGMWNKYLFYYLLSQRKSYIAMGAGGAQPNISKDKIVNSIIALPPLLEQKRIVAKIEELMPFVEQYAAASTKLNTLNTTFPDMMKKSILQEAVQGKLVPQDPNDEPASVLLKKIAEEKKRLIKEGKIKKENELPPITDTEIPFDIPESWEWARLGSLITVRGGKRLPVGKQLITEKTEHVYIRVTDMKNETVDMTDLHYLTEDVYKLISSYIIKKEDIFIVIVGSTIGKAGIIPDELDGMNLTENAARLTPYFVDKRFLLKMITSDFMQAQFVDRTHQVGQPKLALFRLKEAIIPIPPLNEQKRIVERLERFEPEILSLKNNLFR